MIESTAKLREALEKENLTDYQGIPFWSWNNSLDEAALVKQIEEMHEAGLGGFIMHARTGLTTEYLGEKWFSCIDACLKKAKELGMNAWVYDENGWPSGFVGGKLLETEEYRAQFLEYEVKSEYDATAYGVYKKTESGYVRIKAAEAGLTEYHCVYLRTSPANTDILNPAVVEEFIRETHEEYYKRFADSFGKELVGFFTDEPQYYRWATPFSRMTIEPFKERYGEDVVDGLVYLFNKDEEGFEFRTRYYKLMNELYTINFYKRLYDWCEEHNCKLTGHSVEESGLCCQMMGGAGCMPSYEYEHIPGIDCLGRDCGTELSPKQVGSVASQLGIKQVLTETYGCSGFDTTPQELKSLGEYQYFNGVNLMCHHLLPISIAAQGKYDHPPVFSSHNNWFKEMRTFNDYFTRLGYLVANTKENYDVLLLNPMRCVYLTFIHAEQDFSVKELQEAFFRTLNLFRQKGIQYHLADEWLLEKYGSVENGKLRIGKCTYDKVFVPYMPSMSRPTVEILKKYDGKLFVTENPCYVDGVKESVELNGNMTLDDVLNSARVKFACEDGNSGISSRSGELGDFIFVKNYSRVESSFVKMRGVAEEYKALDLTTFETKNISNEYTIPPKGSLVLIKDESAKATKVEAKIENITKNFAVTDVTENYLVLDYASLSYDGEKFGEVMPLPQLFETLLRQNYKGNVYIRHTFNVKSKTAIKLIMEKGRFLSVKVNGVEMTMGKNDFDVNFVETDITSALKEGENVLIYGVDYYQHDGVHFALFDPMATESLRNCLYYDTHIENVYLKGDFVVNADHSIEKRTTLPALSSENYKNGYPFFKGAVTMQGTYEYDGEGVRELSLDKGRFIVANLTVNGEKVDVIMDTKKDITKYLKKGKNDIVIRLKSSLRNLFGPHHFKPIVEPLGVSPTTFTMRGQWKDGVAENYTHDYHVVPFGLDEIEMISY